MASGRGQPITTKNAGDVLLWVPEYRIIVCREHSYAIRDIRHHMRHFHKASRRDQKEVAELFSSCSMLAPKEVPLPPPGIRPFEYLGKPRRAFICVESGCERITVSRDEIRKHCNKQHGWRATKESREHWRCQWVQTFFTAGHESYFSVDVEDDEETGEENAGDDGDDSNRGAVSAALGEWKALKQKHDEELDIAEQATAKTDHTLWFKRNQWPEHLKGRNLRHLSRAIRLPDRDEDLLQKAVEVNSLLIERCVKGLSTLDLETRRWLRSAKLSEPDQRPLGRQQNGDTQARYAGYMARLLCYSLRVLHSDETIEAVGSEEESCSEGSGTGSEGSKDDSSSDDGSSGTQVKFDVMKDARELFPWRGEWKTLLVTFRETLDSHNSSEEAQQDALLEFYCSIIFQKVRGDTFVNILLHFLAVLGIDEELRRLRQANDFSYMLAGIVYCVRVLAVEKLMPSAERDTQNETDDQKFRRLRDAYLADGTFSVMSKMLSLLAYSKNLALNYSNAGSTFWSGDRLVLQYKGQSLELRRFRDFVQGIVQEAESRLGELMHLEAGENWDVDLHKLCDDVTFTKRGWSFVQNRDNNLQGRTQWLLRKALASESGFRLMKGDRLSMPAVRRFLRSVDRFRELLLLCMHVCGGQPARGTEITSLRFRNGFMQDRNVFIIDGQVVFVTRYHKSQSQFDKPKVIPRFLPERVGQLTVMYILYVQELQEYLGVKALKLDWTDYIWSQQGSPWETDRLTRIIRRETERRLGVGLTTHDYRHVAISIGREVVGPMFAKGYQEGMDEHADEQEGDQEGDDDVLEVSAGRGGEIGANRYGVPLDVIKHLSSKTVDTFRPLSAAWHRFLGFGSGQKRKAHARGSSVDLEADMQHSERRSVASDRNRSLAEQFRTLSAQWVAMQGGESNASNSRHGWAAETAGLAWSPLLPLRPSPSRVSPTSISPAAAGTVSRRLFGGDEAERRVGEEELGRAVHKALGTAEYSFRSEEQGEALRTILQDEMKPLVVVLPTGGGKSLLFMAPACLEDPGVTIVVVPFRALLDKLLQTARAAGIDSIEWRPGERNPAALVFVSADFVAGGAFMGYAQLLSMKRLLRRVFVDESHVTFTDSDWRAKLSHVREVRRLRCPVIMLTATLPVIMEHELEASMAVHMARYIRASTIRVKTRYVVQSVKPGTLLDEAIGVCRRMQKHLGLQKGVVYSRSRDQCESLAKELRCAYYHAGAVDNQERLEAWLQMGGLIVATSALGTGVDFPGIVFVLHVDLPYGMIDFAQESGRGGRAGEDVDSVIVVELGRVERAAEQVCGIDDTVMGEFVLSKTCRRGVMSEYLDGRRVECSGEMALCDRCGEGITAIFREHSQAASERARFEQFMDELADSQGCMDCLGGNGLGWESHRSDECSSARTEAEVDGFRAKIRFEGKTHSCFKCGISQKLCRTGVSSTEKCQWPGIARLLRQLGSTPAGTGIAQRCGFEGEQGDLEAFARWVGRAHRGRVWNEVMSNGMFVVKEFFEWRAGLGDGLTLMDKEDVSAGLVENGEADEDGEEEQSVRGGAWRRKGRRAVIISDDEDEERAEERAEERVEEAEGGEQARVWDFKRVLDRWNGVCIICLAVRGIRCSTHSTDGCKDGAHEAEMVRWGIRQVEEMEEPHYEQGRCWTGFIRCRAAGEIRCIWGKLAREVGMALLYGGQRRLQIQDWIEQEGFEVQRAEEGVQELGRFFRRKVEWKDGIEGNMLSEIIWRFG